MSPVTRKILIVEDDPSTCAYLAKGLAEAGYAVETCGDGRDGLFLASEGIFDLIIADRMLPGLSGLAMLGAIRAAGVRTPTLILSALGTVDDRIDGLNGGADDYLVKPFSFAELSARIDAIFRRVDRSTGDGQTTRLSVGDLDIDLLARTVSRQGRAIPLGAREFNLLEYLARHAGQVVTRTMMLEKIWNYHFDPGSNVVDVHIGRLRRKLEDGFAAPILHTVRGGRIPPVAGRVTGTRFRLSVTARIALLAIGLALTSNLVLVAFVWRQVHVDAIDALRRDTIEQSDALVALYRSGGLSALGTAIAQARAHDDVSRVVAVINADGRRVAGVGPERTVALPDQVSFRIGRIGTASPWSQREAGYAVRRIGSDRLVSGRMLDDWQQEQRGIERALAAAMLLSLALGVLGGLVVTRYVGRRLDRVAAVIEGVAAGDLTRRVGQATRPGPKGGGDAFDRLATRLDAMLDKVERLMTELRIVTDGLAHDLRSPLARLRAKVEAAVLRAEPAQREAAMGGLLIETDLVMRMLSTLIEITRAESVPRDRLASLDPAALLGEIAELYAPVVEDAGLRFQLVMAAGAPPIVLHRELMTQAIANLIDNALRHAASGGSITLRLLAEAGDMAFRVEDHGPGIAEADRAEALRRFGRLDRARSLPGAGLGMALVEAVARLHGGRLELGDNAPGLVAAIVVPVAL